MFCAQRSHRGVSVTLSRLSGSQFFHYGDRWPSVPVRLLSSMRLHTKSELLQPKQRIRLLEPQHPVERVGRLVDQRFREMQIRMKVFEGEKSVVADAFKGFEDGGPIGSAV